MEVLQGKTVQKERGLPKGWKEVKLNQVAEIDKESLPGNTNKSYEFDYISLSDVDSNSLRIETSKQVFENAPSRARRIVRKGDVLMSTVRPNLQGFTIIRNEVINLIASTGFAVIRPKSIISEFLFQYLFSGIISKQFYSLLVGSNYPAINSSDVKNLKILLPPLPEQRAIADCLSTWDGAIQVSEQLIRQKELQKKWLMQQLLTGKKRLKGFSGEWEDVELGDLLEYQQPTKHLVKSTLYSNSYKTPVLTAGKTFILGYTNELEGICRNLPVMIFDDFTTASKYVDFPFKAKSSAMKLLRPKPDVNLKFVYESMRLINYVVGGHERHWISKFTYLSISIPTYYEQNAIASVISESDRELDLLRNRLQKIREQKKGLMQVLLTGKRRLKTKNI
jgi:type I restriction enzyme S subunit